MAREFVMPVRKSGARLVKLERVPSKKWLINLVQFRENAVMYVFAKKWLAQLNVRV
jgi:hypothetical protein